MSSTKIASRGGVRVTAALALLLFAACSSAPGASESGGAATSNPVGANLHTWELLVQQDTAFAAAGSTAGTWANLGPAPSLLRDLSSGKDIAYSGRVVYVSVNPTNANQWLIAADQGGVWKTVDGGTTWTATTDGQATLRTRAVSFAPGNSQIAYAGTGGDGSGGLLQSSDGGSTWSLRATLPFSKADTTDIRVDPAGSSTVLAATNSFAFDSTTNGVFRSTDGGATFTQKLAGRVSELEVDPTSFARQYAALSNCCGDPSTVPSGLRRSLDGGQTWSAIHGPWESVSPLVENVELAIAPSNVNVLYASIQYDSNGSAHFWQTSSAWAATPTWTELPLPPELFNDIIVDPSNSSTVYVGAVALYRFNGTSYVDVSRAGTFGGIHVDQRGLAFAGNRLIVGDDGGVFSTIDGGTTWSNHNTNLSISQFYEGSLHPTNPNVALGGTQDDGSPLFTGTSTWRIESFGDGMDNIFSLTNPDTTYATSVQGLNILRTMDNGANFFSVSDGIVEAARPFFTKFEQCPASSDIVIAGTDQVWLTTNFFSSGNVSPSTEPTWTVNSPEPAHDGDPITALAIAPSVTTCNTYALGGNDGRLSITQNRGATWTDLDPSNLVPDCCGGVTRLAFDPTNANVLYLTLDLFDANHSTPGHVYKSTNALSASPTWVNVSAPNSDTPHRALVIDPINTSTIYVGTELGIFRTTDAGQTWIHYGLASGMPFVNVTDLVFAKATDRLMAFTYGRGAFLFAPPSSATQINAGGGAVAPFVVDVDFTGGGTINHPNTIDLSGVTNPAPMAVYQTARVGNFSYTIPGFTAGQSKTVRLHFAETFFSSKGSRTFNVSINGMRVLAAFDIFAAAGAKNKAVIKEFTENANTSGAFVIQFTSVVNQSLVSGIEIQ
jgi:photosystem II stability/assembly factor-like uncharacterized protein